MVLEKEGPKKLAGSSSTKTTKPPAAPAAEPKDAQPKRKPRKLNKEPSTATKDISSTSISSASTEVKELEALKSRVRGLEAKVEELYKSAPPQVGAGGAARSPRRRGKGRKNSSATTTATLGGLAREKENQTPGQVLSVDNDEEEAEEELVRLEDELEHARQDLALYHPSTPTSANQRPRSRRSPADDADEVVEEIPRDRPAVERPSADRQVTLSGSYRIPLPASLNPEDVKTIQSGVAAAQNVARSFLDQRRAGRGAPADAGPLPQAQAKGKAKRAQRAQRAQEGEGNEGVVGAEGGKMGWGEWIGGYSVAISRAVKSIEHEAAMEKSSRAGVENKRGKRPGVKTGLSGEQIEGLMG